MPRNPYINSREVLVTFERYGEDEVTGQNLVRVEFATAQTVLAALHENTSRVLRLDLENGSYEDITEELADIVLDDVRSDNVGDQPPFVRDHAYRVFGSLLDNINWVKHDRRVAA